MRGFSCCMSLSCGKNLRKATSAAAKTAHSRAAGAKREDSPQPGHTEGDGCVAPPEPSLLPGADPESPCPSAPPSLLTGPGTGAEPGRAQRPSPTHPRVLGPAASLPSGAAVTGEDNYCTRGGRFIRASHRVGKGWDRDFGQGGDPRLPHARLVPAPLSSRCPRLAGWPPSALPCLVDSNHTPPWCDMTISSASVCAYGLYVQSNSAPQVPRLETPPRMSFPTSPAARGAGPPRTAWLLFHVLSVAAFMDQEQSQWLKPAFPSWPCPPRPRRFQGHRLSLSHLRLLKATGAHLLLH